VADFYEVLGVSRTASGSEIRQAYARQARERHPDRFSDPVEKARAQELFRDITAAFNTLSNERARREYDAELERPRPTTPEDIAKDAYTRALERLEAREPEQAVELLRAAVHHVPGEAGYHAALALAMSRVPRLAREAVQQLEKAVQLAPRNAGYHAELAMLLLNQGLKLRARRALEAALQIAPDDPRVRRAADYVGAEDDSGPPEGGGGLRGLLRRKP
jgi:curved DNA-binding protein CbpA